MKAHKLYVLWIAMCATVAHSIFEVTYYRIWLRIYAQHDMICTENVSNIHHDSFTSLKTACICAGGSGAKSWLDFQHPQ